MLNAFTVDVEDYYQVSAFESCVNRQQWDIYPSRVAENTNRLLGLLDTLGVRATFFVLGWVARKCPDLAPRIVRAGHEIGSHGYWHRLVYHLTPEEFRADVVASRDVLQDQTGLPVVAYRAPSFSITRRSWWALEVLVEEGFRYDSSIYPIFHHRYGVPDAPRDIHEIQTRSGPICEFPPAVYRLGKLNVPVSGGGYFRLYPYRFTAGLLDRTNRRRPFVFYVHPWEVDPSQPRLRAGSHHGRFRHYVNLGRTHAKLERLLTQFRFGALSDVVERHAFDRKPTPLPELATV